MNTPPKSDFSLFLHSRKRESKPKIKTYVAYDLPQKKIEWTDERLSSLFSLTITSTDYGRSMKPSSIKIPNFWAWADKFWGIWCIFDQFSSTHFGAVSLLSMFSAKKHYFYKSFVEIY